MTPEEITESLRGVKSWEEAHPLQRGSFALEMSDRQFGKGPLLQAWLWFLDGWRACRAQHG